MSEIYDDGTGSEIPWKPPVIAAIIGAVLVAGFVIFALVTGPVEEPGEDSLILQPVPSTDVPPGYTVLPGDPGVGVKVESVTSRGGSTKVVVSSAVEGATDAADFPPPDVAYWETGSEEARITMDGQSASVDAPGTTTIVFAAETIDQQTSVVAYAAAATTSESATMEVGPDAIGEPIAFGLGFESGVAISGELTVGYSWGTVEWDAPDGMVATLDVVVTLVGTENLGAGVLEPVRLVPAYDADFARPGSIIAPRPLWGFGGSYTLNGDGRSLGDDGDVSKIVIELSGTVVTETAEPIILDLPAGGT